MIAETGGSQSNSLSLNENGEASFTRIFTKPPREFIAIQNLKNTAVEL